MVFVGVKKPCLLKGKFPCNWEQPHLWRTAGLKRRGSGRTVFFCVRTKLLLRSRCTEVNRGDKTLGREPRERVRHISSKFDRPRWKSAEYVNEIRWGQSIARVKDFCNSLDSIIGTCYLSISKLRKGNLTQGKNKTSKITFT